MSYQFQGKRKIVGFQFPVFKNKKGFRVMSRNRQMGIAEFCVLVFISLSFVSSSSSSLHRAVSSDLMQERKFKEGKGLYAYVAKGGGGGGGGGHSGSSGHTSPHTGGNGDDGGESKPTQGGAAVIPAYVAGAAGAANANNHHHHGSNNANLNRIEFPTLLIITFLCTPLLHACLFM